MYEHTRLICALMPCACARRGEVESDIEAVQHLIDVLRGRHMDSMCTRACPVPVHELHTLYFYL